MRGDVSGQHGVFSYVSLENRVRADHPLRTIKVSHRGRDCLLRQ
jgi:hypothetical protein